MSEIRSCIVTGSNGLLGSALVRDLQSRGIFVYGLARRRASEDQWGRFELADAAEVVVPPADLVIHAAWDFGAPAHSAWAINGAGTLGLFSRARENGIQRCLFVSTMSAHSGARSIYGRTKFRLEQMLSKEKIASVRPGLICGEQVHGIFGMIRKLATRSPIVPVPFPDRPRFFLADLDLAARAIIDLALDGDLQFARPVVIASETPRSISDIVTLLSRKGRRRSVLVPVPSEMLIIGLRFLEKLRIPTPFRSDSALSLISESEELGDAVFWKSLPEPKFFEVLDGA